MMTEDERQPLLLIPNVAFTLGLPRYSASSVHVAHLCVEEREK